MLSNNLIFRISPLIRITLILLYFSLTIPLPFLAQISTASVSPQLLWIGIALGFVALFGVLSEQVILDDHGIQVTYPFWISSFFCKGWSLTWKEVKDLKMRTTGQGGLVYYFINDSGQAFLLPMRIVGFTRLVQQVQEKTGIDTRDVRPLAQPWMYLILLVFTFFLLLIDLWTIFTAIA